MEDVLSTGMQELVLQLMLLVIAGVYAAMKMAIEKYEFENKKVERILLNAVSYAEEVSSTYAKSNATKIASSEKLDFARAYVNSVDPKIIAKYGKELDVMLRRKLNQVRK